MDDSSNIGLSVTKRSHGTCSTSPKGDEDRKRNRKSQKEPGLENYAVSSFKIIDTIDYKSIDILAEGILKTQEAAGALADKRQV